MISNAGKISFNEAIIYFFVALFTVSTSLVAWLSLKIIALSEKTTAIIEQNRSMDARLMEFHNELSEFRIIRTVLTDRVDQLEIEAARHGWKDKR